MTIITCRQKFTIQQYGTCCHTANSFNNYLNENVPDYIRKENWSPNSCDFNILDYTIWDMMKKMLYKNVKHMKISKGFQQQYQMHGIDWQKESSWSHWASSLTTLTYDSTYISRVIDILFITRKMNMIT